MSECDEHTTPGICPNSATLIATRNLSEYEQSRRHALLMRDYQQQTQALTGIKCHLAALETPVITIHPDGKFEVRYDIDAAYQALHDQIDDMCRSIMQQLIEAYGFPTPFGGKMIEYV